MDRSAVIFNPYDYSDAPLYNIQAVSSATGVPAITLRSWERRYRVPLPKRNANGYRLYSEQDIAVTRWLRERVRHGVSISRAVDMLHAARAGQIVQERKSAFAGNEIRSRLLDAIRALSDAGVRQAMAHALMVGTVEDVCLEVVQPVLEQVGTEWEERQISVTTEHVGSQLVRAQLAGLVHLSPAPWRAETVVVGCAPGELHDIGALILTLFLRRRGFDVIFAGASVEPESFVADLERLRPAAVLLSAATIEPTPAIATIYERFADGFPGIRAFGGRIFNHQDGLREQIPGTYLGPDAGSAVRRLEMILTEG